MCRWCGPVPGILHDIIAFVIRPRHFIHSSNSKSTEIASRQVVATCVDQGQSQKHLKLQRPGDTALIGMPPLGSKCRCCKNLTVSSATRPLR